MAIKKIPCHELEKNKQQKKTQTSRKQSQLRESANNLYEFCTLALFWWMCVESEVLYLKVEFPQRLVRNKMILALTEVQ